MIDILLPRTDAGVLAQALVVFALLGGVLALVRRDREGRQLVLGVAMLALAWFGVRAIH